MDDEQQTAYKGAETTGFQSPARDHIEHVIDLARVLDLRQPGIYPVRVSGQAFAERGIRDGCWQELVTLPALTPMRLKVHLKMVDKVLLEEEAVTTSATGPFVFRENDYEVLMSICRSHALLLATLLCLPRVSRAQNKQPIKVETFPATPILGGMPRDRLSPLRPVHPMVFAAPLLLDAQGTTGFLALANASSVNTSATITFYTPDGRRESQSIIKLEPHGKAEIPLLNKDVAATPRGSVTVEQAPDADGIVVAGQVILTDRHEAIPSYLDEELAMPDEEGSSTLRAVSDESVAPPLVALTNTSNEAQKATMTCLLAKAGSHPIQIEVAAHATVTMTACGGALTSIEEYRRYVERAPSPGVYGVEIVGDGDPGSLVAFGLAPHQHGADLVFSAVSFYDPQTINSSGTVFAGVPIGSQESLPQGVYIPRLSLANFADKPVTLAITLADTRTAPARSPAGNLQPPLVVPIKTLTLAPHSAEEFVFSGQEAQNGLLHSVLIDSNGPPGSYQAKLVSRSTGTLYQVELLAKELLDPHNTGIHPWTLNDDTEAHIILFNHKNEESKVGVFVTGKKSSWTTELHLAPLETREISINALEAEGTPDKDGHLLGREESGVVNWVSPDSGRVTGRLMVTSRAEGMARNFSCTSHTIICRMAFTTYLNDLTVGDVESLYGAAGDGCSAPVGSCSSNTGAAMVGMTTWTVGDASVIKLNTAGDSSGNPRLAGMGPGHGTARATITGGGCTVSGTGYPTLKPCVEPTGETTAIRGNGITNTTQIDFTQTLTGTAAYPAPIDNGSIITEGENANGVDGCHFAGSTVDESLKVQGSSWTVGYTLQANVDAQAYPSKTGQWGPDIVGFQNAAVRYYQQQRAMRGLPLPCTATLYQYLNLACPTGVTYPSFDANIVLSSTIDSTGVTVCREGSCAAHVAYQ